MPVAKIYQFYDILSEKPWRLDTSAHADAMMRKGLEDYFSDDEMSGRLNRESQSPNGITGLVIQVAAAAGWVLEN